jgi:hypothetical protein
MRITGLERELPSDTVIMLRKQSLYKVLFFCSLIALVNVCQRVSPTTTLIPVILKQQQHVYDYCIRLLCPLFLKYMHDDLILVSLFVAVTALQKWLSR